MSHYLLAGYNNLEVAEYLLQHGADVNAQDKGGLIPLHNAASYGVSSLKSLESVKLKQQASSSSDRKRYMHLRPFKKLFFHCLLV